MKKILEVLQYKEGDIRFNTDFDPEKNPEELICIISQVMLAMSTTLWGGNETNVLAMIRALAIADLGLSVNRQEMIRQLDLDSANFARIFRISMEAVEKSGGKVTFFDPCAKPSKTRS